MPCQGVTFAVDASSVSKPLLSKAIRGVQDQKSPMRTSAKVTKSKAIEISGESFALRWIRSKFLVQYRAIGVVCTCDAGSVCGGVM